MKRLLYTGAWLTLLFFWQLSALQAQVSLAPVAVMVHDDTNVGSLYISNQSNETREVSVTMKFGYPDSDSLGSVVMNYDDTEKAGRYGLDDRMRVFPRNFVLEPNQQQTVRLQILPNQNKPDGVYWTRIRVISNALTRNADEEIAEGVSTRINYRFEQNIAAFYRKGIVTTGVKVEEISTEKNETRLSVITRASRTGNSPFVGSMTAELFDAAGEKAGEAHSPATFYFNEKRGLSLDIEELPPGTYRLDIHFDTRRRDISTGDLVQAPRSTESIIIEL